jgi:hypothetical protein
VDELGVGLLEILFGVSPAARPKRNKKWNLLSSNCLISPRILPKLTGGGEMARQKFELLAEKRMRRN